MRLLRSSLTLTAVLLVVAACGGDDGNGDTDGALIIESDADGIITDDVPDVDDLVPLEDDEDAGEVQDSSIDIDLDELEEVVGEAFEGNDRGRGSGTIAGRSHVIVTVDPADVTEAEMVAGCEALTDFVDGLPEERASGPVDILVSADMTVGPDEQYLVANEQLIPRENRGSCVVQ